MINKLAIREAWRLYIQPYAVWFKVGLLVLLFAAGWYTSAKYHKNADAQVDAELATDLAICRKANYDYEQADKQRATVAAAAAAAQREREEAAEAAVVAAQKRAGALEGKLAAIEKRQRDAANDPKCRDIMELEVCPALR